MFASRKGLSGFTFGSKKIRLQRSIVVPYIVLFSIKNRHEVWRVSSVNTWNEVDLDRELLRTYRV